LWLRVLASLRDGIGRSSRGAGKTSRFPLKIEGFRRFAT